MKFDFVQTRWTAADSCGPLHVGIHLINLLVEAHLAYRQNAVGGGNVIATPAHRGKLPKDVRSIGVELNPAYFACRR
ncbi:hypothetical protein [Amycolatopsis pigmentata]|uniref:DNA methylase n=1 Tax=Amycolatopsis pigmentata TaxID=450801 RepID=A0ABW5FKQ8_9PSEU